MSVSFLCSKYSNVRSEFLWEELQKQVNLHRPDIEVPVSDLMSDWINKPGHPVLSVKISKDYIHISQERFLLEKSDESAEQNLTWYIPITMTSQSDPNFTNAETGLWMKEELTLELVNASQQWVVLNRLGAGNNCQQIRKKY